MVWYFSPLILILSQVPVLSLVNKWRILRFVSKMFQKLFPSKQVTDFMWTCPGNKSILYWLAVPVLQTGFNFPRGTGAYAPRFFSLGARKSMKNNLKSCFWQLVSIERSRCQTLNVIVLFSFWKIIGIASSVSVLTYVRVLYTHVLPVTGEMS